MKPSKTFLWSICWTDILKCATPSQNVMDCPADEQNFRTQKRVPSPIQDLKNSQRIDNLFLASSKFNIVAIVAIVFWFSFSHPPVGHACRPCGVAGALGHPPHLLPALPGDAHF